MEKSNPGARDPLENNRGFQSLEFWWKLGQGLKEFMKKWARSWEFSMEKFHSRSAGFPGKLLRVLEPGIPGENGPEMEKFHGKYSSD